MSDLLVVWTRIGVEAKSWEKLEKLAEEANVLYPDKPKISPQTLAGAIISNVVKVMVEDDPQERAEFVEELVKAHESDRA